MIVLLIVLVVGLSGIAAEIILLRELLIGFLGNELIIGIILANWIFAESCGVFIAGKISNRTKKHVDLFVVFQIAFAAAVPLALYASRCFKSFIGLTGSEGTGLGIVFIISLVVVFLPGFLHGALFTLCCSLIPGKNAIGKTYTWETLGTLIGGFILSFIFITHLNSFQIAYCIVAAAGVTCLIPLKQTRRATRILFIVSSVFLILTTVFVFPANRINAQSIQRQWENHHIIDYRNSPYGNIVLVQENSQLTYFYNGLPVITTPNPDISFVEEYTHFPLLFHPHPQIILVINQGAGGIIREILKYNPQRIDYTELDPLIFKLLAQHPSSLTAEELNSSRVKIIAADARAYLRQTTARYDVIILGMNTPSDLANNRYFTQEFFKLAQEHLNPEGILELRLPGSLTYMSKELIDLNGSVKNAIEKYFSHIRVIPGDTNYYLASNDSTLDTISPAEISRRITTRGIPTKILIPAYIENRLTDRNEWFYKNMRNQTTTVNTDLRPITLLQNLILWNKQYSPHITAILIAASNLRFSHCIATIFILTVLVLAIARRKPRRSIVYSIAGTGFFGMLINLILMFAFQIVHGSLFHYIALLTALFMAGAAGGSIMMGKHLEKTKKPVLSFIIIEVMIILFSIFIGLTTPWILTQQKTHSFFYLSSLITTAGFLLGLAFPLAAWLYKRKTGSVAETSGILYASDLAGGWIAGILGSVILLPTIGIVNTCLVVALLKVSTLTTFLLHKNKF